MIRPPQLGLLLDNHWAPRGAESAHGIACTSSLDSLPFSSLQTLHALEPFFCSLVVCSISCRVIMIIIVVVIIVMFFLLVLSYSLPSLSCNEYDDSAYTVFPYKSTVIRLEGNAMSE